MAKITKLLRNIPKKLPAADQLNRALDLCSNDVVPDYAAFKHWLAKKLQDPRQQVPVSDPLGARQSFALSAAQEFARLSEVIKRATRDTPPEFKDFLKFKLLISWFNVQSERGADFITNVLTAKELDDVQLTEGLSAAPPADLRNRLFAAMDRDRGHDAFLILGHLKEGDLDPGEYAYLRALCHFRAGQFKEAIEYAKRVPLSGPDGPRAVEIRAKSHAYLGDAVGVKESIGLLAKDALSVCQILLLAELTAYHSGALEDAGIAVGDHPVFRDKPEISANDAGFGEFQKFHVLVLTGFEERRMEIGDAMAAKQGTDAISADWNAIVSSDPVLRRTSVALALEPRIAAEVSSPPSLSALVINSLLPAINEGDREALLILFQSFYRLGAYEDFMT